MIIGATILLVGIAVGYWIKTSNIVSVAKIKRLVSSNKAKIIDTSPDVDLGNEE